MVSDGQRDPCHCLATARWSHSPGLLEWPPGFRGCPDQSETANRPARQTALRPDTLLGPAHGEFLGGRLSAHRAHTKSFAYNGSCGIPCCPVPSVNSCFSPTTRGFVCDGARVDRVGGAAIHPNFRLVQHRFTADTRINRDPRMVLGGTDAQLVPSISLECS